MPSLENLNLAQTKVTNSGIGELVELPSLKGLSLVGTSVGNEAIRLLSRSKTLQRLGLNETRIDDQGLEHIPVFPSLNSLALWGTKISDEGLKHLRKTKLKRFELVFANNDQITDKGLVYLQDIKTLKYLIFHPGTKATAEGLGQLQRALPKLDIFTGKK